MTEVRGAGGAGDLDAGHAVAPILDLGDALLRGRLPEAGAAGTRVELGVRPVQRFPAADADVDALVLAVVVLSRVEGARSRPYARRRIARG